MELLLGALVPALAGAALARWTHWHPLVIAGMLGSVPALLAMVAAAGTLADGATVLVAGAMAFVVAGAFAGFGTFMGWLRRAHVGRTG